MPESPATVTVVLDTTVVIHLAKADRLDILSQLEGYAFVVPDQVVAEVSYPEQEKALNGCPRRGTPVARIEHRRRGDRALR